MALLSPAQFAAKWTPLLANNVFQDIDGVRLQQLITDISDSFAATTSGVNVPDWQEGTYYRLGFVILYSVTNTFYKAQEAGYLDSPSGPEAELQWEATLSPAGDNALYQVGTVAALRAARGRWVPGRLYVLHNRLDPATSAALPDVYVRAIGINQLEPEGYVIDNSALSAVPVHVSYDLAIDETAPVVAGAGDGYSKDEVNALLDEKGSEQVQAQHTQQLTSLTALVPAKATATNQFATLADIGQVTFVDVPLALTSGSYAIPADCAGKRFVISDGTADTFINLRALNNDSVGKVFALSITNGVRQQLKALAFGQYTGGDYIELGETALLLVGKQAAGPGFYYYAFKIGVPAAVKSVNGVLPDAAGNVVIATGGGSDTYKQLDFQPAPTLDLSLATAQLLTLTNNVGFAGTSNRAQGRQVRVFLFNNTAAAVTLTFPSPWAFLGVKPTTLAAGKKGVLTLECVYGSAEGDIVAGYIDQN